MSESEEDSYEECACKSNDDCKKQTPEPLRGFARPVPISYTLSIFIGNDPLKLISRPQVTKLLTNYIKLHKLQNEDDKRKINPDEPLRNLLQMPNDIQLTFFNLQKYLRIHFIKKEELYNIINVITLLSAIFIKKINKKSAIKILPVELIRMSKSFLW